MGIYPTAKDITLNLDLNLVLDAIRAHLEVFLVLFCMASIHSKMFSDNFFILLRAAIEVKFSWNKE